jgi:t-SNARE complex subunit (syntaxin)
MKFRIIEIIFKGETIYEPQVRKYAVSDNGHTVREYWEDLVNDPNINEISIQYSGYPKSVDEARKIIKDYHEQHQKEIWVKRKVQEFDLTDEFGERVYQNSESQSVSGYDD